MNVCFKGVIKDMIKWDRIRYGRRVYVCIWIAFYKLTPCPSFKDVGHKT
jgi:hypothetical protein